MNVTHVFHAGIMDRAFDDKPFDAAKFMLMFSVENMAKARAEGDRRHKEELLLNADVKAEGKPEVEHSDDSQCTIPYNSDDSQRTIPYNSDDSVRTQPYVPDAEQQAFVPVPRPRLLANEAMKKSCTRFNQEMRAKRKPCIVK